MVTESKCCLINDFNSSTQEPRAHFGRLRTNFMLCSAINRFTAAKVQHVILSRFVDKIRDLPAHPVYALFGW